MSAKMAINTVTLLNLVILRLGASCVRAWNRSRFLRLVMVAFSYSSSRSRITLRLYAGSVLWNRRRSHQASPLTLKLMSSDLRRPDFHHKPMAKFPNGCFPPGLPFIHA